MDDLPLAEESDREILMHRDVHFAGSFHNMLDYYQKDGKGAQADFLLPRIYELEAIEKELGQNLSDLLLSSEEFEEIEEAKEQYVALRSLYEERTENDILGHLLADLLLSENDPPKQEIERLVNFGEKAVEPLIRLMMNEEYSSPLAPGYGLAPSYAAACLGEIKNPKAMIPLFEMLGRTDFATEEAILKAMTLFGEDARVFLLKILQSQPITHDNTQAALALLSFSDFEKIAPTFLALLHKKIFLSCTSLASYLLVGCTSIKDPDLQNELLLLSETSSFPKELLSQVEELKKSWKL